MRATTELVAVEPSVDLPLRLVAGATLDARRPTPPAWGFHRRAAAREQVVERARLGPNLSIHLPEILERQVGVQLAVRRVPQPVVVPEVARDGADRPAVQPPPRVSVH